MKHFVMGTAGHAGHGKTSIIRALTGAGTALPSGAAGHAQMRFDETLLELVDLPGGDLEAMAAGVADTDLVLLVVAADEGVTDGTLEHLRMLSLLDVSRCIVVITKTDLADDGAMVRTREAVHGLYGAWGLPACAPVVEMDARTGQGAEDLLAAIVEQCARMPIRRIDRPFYMHIDQVSPRRGGAVTAGTVREGRALAGEEIMLCPSGASARIRAIYGSTGPLEAAEAGQRVMLELYTEELPACGGALSARLPDAEAGPMDMALLVLPECGRTVEDGARLWVHVGAASLFCQVRLLKNSSLAPGQGCYGQLVPETPLSVLAGERFLFRFPDSAHWMGGGTILDAHAPLRRQENCRAAWSRLSCYEHGGPDGRLLWEASADLCTEAMLRQRFIRWSDTEFRRTRDSLLAQDLLVRAGEWLLGAQLAGALKGELIAQLTRRHAREPLEPGMSLEEARSICPGDLLELCIRDGTVRSDGFWVALPLFDPRKTRRFWQLASVLMELVRQEGPLSSEELARRTGFPEREISLALTMLEKDGVKLDMEGHGVGHAVRCEK